MGGANGRCLDLHDMAFKTCAGALADGGKVIDLLPETDVEWGGDAERGVNPDGLSCDRDRRRITHPGILGRLPEPWHAGAEPGGIRAGVPSSTRQLAGMAEGTGFRHPAWPSTSPMHHPGA